MFINKIGQSHIDYGINNQDYGFCNEIKCVVDGCSQGKHSEVGAKLFCKNMINNPTRLSTQEIIEKTLIWYFEKEDIVDYMLFTILQVFEDDYNYIVRYCGDGYIILIDNENNVKIKQIEDGNIGEYPLYFAYKYVSEKQLGNIRHSDCEFITMIYPKSEYKNVGVATDGLRYIFGTEFEKQFIELLAGGKEIQIKRLINKYQNYFKDDITISL